VLSGLTSQPGRLAGRCGNDGNIAGPGDEEAGRADGPRSKQRSSWCAWPRPSYAAIGVSLDGERNIRGLWVAQGGEGAKFWIAVLTDPRNRGRRGPWRVRGVGRAVGTAIPGDHPVVGQRVADLHPIPRLRDIEIRRVLSSRSSIESRTPGPFTR
jgi:Transposase, Mutator family